MFNYFPIITLLISTTEALQQEFVIPRTPSPGPDVRAVQVQVQDPRERIARLKVNTPFSPNQRRRLTVQQREIDEIKAEPKFKREAHAGDDDDDYDDDDDVQIVSSSSSKRLKISHNDSGAEMIDLTDD